MKRYLKLPVIHSFYIENYSLFKDSWQFTLQPGLNILLGANAIGKTTTINLIIYGLVGDYQDSLNNKIDSKYFLERLISNNDITSENATPKIAIEFFVGDSKIKISRNISNNNIITLQINGKDQRASKISSLNIQYEKALKELSGIEDLDDLRFLLSKLLIREEEGNYLLWDQVSQSRMLRLLANISGFQKEFKILEDELQRADSTYKREADFLSKMRGRKKDMEDSRERDLSQKVSAQSKVELESFLVKYKEERRKIQEKILELIDRNAVINSAIRKTYDEVDSLKLTIDLFEEEYNSLEKKFYHDSFNSFKTNLAYNKLGHRHTCIVCNTKLNDTKSKEVIKVLSSTHNCPLCQSKIIVESESEKDGTINERLNSLNNSIKANVGEYEKLQKNLQPLFNEIEIYNRELEKAYSKNKELSLSILSTQTNLDQILKSGDSEYTDYDLAIRRMEEDILNYEERVKPLLEKFNKKKLSLSQKNNELNDTIDKIENRLNQIFSRHAKSYFNETCALHLRKDKKPAGLEVPLSYFVPNFNNKQRLFHSRVSKSEAIFLEYLFRISILELYHSLTKIKPFLILETSEGSFDITNTALMGETFSEIGKLGFPFVIITNLSKIEFISSMMPTIKERKKRIFNLLTHSNLSANQKKKEKELIAALKELGVK